MTAFNVLEVFADKAAAAAGILRYQKKNLKKQKKHCSQIR